MRSTLVLAVLALLAEAARAGDPDLGARVYAERCGGCHGDEGRGDGPAAPALIPKPRNFHDAAFWHDRTPAQIAGVIRTGKPGTMMPPFDGLLTAAEIDAVAHFLVRFAPAAAPGQ